MHSSPWRSAYAIARRVPCGLGEARDRKWAGSWVNWWDSAPGELSRSAGRHEARCNSAGRSSSIPRRSFARRKGNAPAMAPFIHRAHGNCKGIPRQRSASPGLNPPSGTKHRRTTTLGCLLVNRAKCDRCPFGVAVDIKSLTCMQQLVLYDRAGRASPRGGWRRYFHGCTAPMVRRS